VGSADPLLSRRTLRQEDMMQLAIDTGNQRKSSAGWRFCRWRIWAIWIFPMGYNSVKLITVGDIILKGQGIGNGIVSGRVAIGEIAV